MKKPVVIKKPVVMEDLSSKTDGKGTLVESLPEAEPVEFTWQAASDAKPKPTVKVASDMTRWIVLGVVALVLGVGVFFGVQFVQEKLERLNYIQSTVDKVKDKLPTVDKIKEKLPIPKQASVIDLISHPKETKVLESKNLYLRLHHPDGKIEMRTGGSVAWRLNNPGRILYGDFAKSYGAIGEFSKYAIFPKYAKGREALYDYLFKSNIYRNLTIKAAMDKFAPKNKSTTYTKEITKKLVVSSGTIMAEIGENKRNELLNVVQRLENYHIAGVSKTFANEAEWKEKGY